MRYFFHAQDAHDSEGLELATIADARHEAAVHLCTLMKDDAFIHSGGKDFEVKVTNADGLILFSFLSIFVEAASISSGM